MFGYIQANMNDLSEEEKERYGTAYCGLCYTLGQLHGSTSRLALSYDLTFLFLLLSSLYEPEEQCGKKRCLIHPCKKHMYAVNAVTEYAADMTVALTYFNCLDDWHDDRKLSGKCFMSILETKYQIVKQRWPRQCKAIETEIDTLSKIEAAKATNPDEAANCSGRMIEAIFVPYEDNWEPYLRKIGFGLGKFIYLADAACDYYRDIKKDNYNPLVLLSKKPEEIRPVLTQILGIVSKAFEILPLVQDSHLLKNIIYSGIWVKYNQQIQKQQKGA